MRAVCSMFGLCTNLQHIFCFLFLLNSAPTHATSFDPVTSLASYDPNLRNIGNDSRRKIGANGQPVSINQWIRDALELADQIMTQAIPKFAQVALENQSNVNNWTLDAMKRTQKRLIRLKEGDGKIEWALPNQTDYGSCLSNSNFSGDALMYTNYRKK